MKEWSNQVYQSIRKPSIKACQFIGINSHQVTILNHILTLTIGCYAFAQGSHLWGIVGLMVCLINGFIDYLDGDLARESNSLSKYGAWLDSGFDVIIQNAVMAAIAIGCVKSGMGIFWAMFFMLGNAANNMVSFHYNSTFGFDSDKGNELFRSYMDKKRNPFNIFIKNIIDPTSSYWALVLFTYRYWIAVGMVFHIMPVLFVIITIISNVKWMIMYLLYAKHLTGDKSLHVLNALSILDEERQEFYTFRKGLHANV